MEARGIKQMTRASTHYFTTDDEIDCLASAVEDIARA
jgi:selenocysteine lyase/cysteine desulfurase